jgi:WD40 repeat protein
LAGRADQRRADRLGHAIEYHDALTAEITSVAYGPDGRLCATASADHRVLLWDAKTWQQVPGFEASGPAVCLAFSPDGVPPS